ncbi:aldehyde dehydrogenase family protein [Marinobacter sp. ELB17]|uniref:aldehyde dehydrogenase family protein n=1 Tax=Marinobacter sp. ELB17 TaxID=270374 RepID=UPI001D0D5F81|nr:aldehyde dehydrogenase family protein [Marinobacter sp. ELB17]
MTGLDMPCLDKQFINNQWVASHGQRRLTVTDPFRESVIAEVTAGDPADVDVAVAAARLALPAWRRLSGTRRADYLDGFADALTKRREALIRLSSTNNGKAIAEAAIDLDDAIACYRYYAGQARALDARQGESVALEMKCVVARCYHDPVGVVGLITPWNFPLVTSAWKLAPALAAGCTVILKPSEVTPLPEQVLADIALDIGLPAGVLNLLHGDGQGISRHPGIDKVSFTGSNRVGEAVMRAASDTTKGISLELGGKSPILVMEEEAIELANDSDFGLVATVISGDSERAQRIGREMQAGSIWFNSEQLVLSETGWGGFKRSSIGRELGPWGLAAYLEVKHIIGPAS